MLTALTNIEITGLQRISRGKVRDVFTVDDSSLLLVASDRLSAFDVVLAEGIPNKGQVLTQMAAFWFSKTASRVHNHVITTDDRAVQRAVEQAGGVWTAALSGRSMLCRRTKPLPIEAVVRGYLAGSAWKEYKAHPGELWGHALPVHLVESSAFSTPIYTPSSKATQGHDLPMQISDAADLLGNYALQVQDISMDLYGFAAKYVSSLGLILADTKLEFGVTSSGELLVIDEVFTPDCSRYWPADSYKTSMSPPSFDKQFVRDYLESLDGWNKQYPPPPIPADIVDKTRQKYLDVFSLITGTGLQYE